MSSKFSTSCTCTKNSMKCYKWILKGKTCDDMTLALVSRPKQEQDNGNKLVEKRSLSMKGSELIFWKQMCFA
jgi:serine/threonine protein phosphatase PrpC